MYRCAIISNVKCTDAESNGGRLELAGLAVVKGTILKRWPGNSPRTAELLFSGILIAGWKDRCGRKCFPLWRQFWCGFMRL